MRSVNDLILEKLIKILKIPIIVFIWSGDCSPCMILKNIIKEIEKLFKKKIKIIKLNIKNNKYTIEKFSINSAPTTIIIMEKEIVLKKYGLYKKEYLKKTIDDLILQW